MDLQHLEAIGLKEKEAKIYVALLKSGPSLANKLAKETGILRSSIYDYLDILLDRGFVSYVVRSGKKYFQAEDPQRTLETLQESQRVKLDALRGLLPDLTALYGTATQQPIIEVFEGKEGMKTVMNRILRDAPNEFLAYGSSGVSHLLLPYFMEHWHKERVAKHIGVRIIYNDSEQTYQRITKGPSTGLMDMRVLPIKNFSIIGTIIYQQTVVLSIWDLHTPFAISIQAENIAIQFKENFEILWVQAQPYENK